MGAVDAAALQAHAVAFAFCHGRVGDDANTLPTSLLEHLDGLAKTAPMKKRLSHLRQNLAKLKPDTDDVALLRKIVEGSDRRPGSGFDFQIASIDMMPCVFWITARYWAEPEEAIMRAIAIG